MGFFSGLGKLVRNIGDPGGSIIYKATGGKGSRPNTLKSGFDPVAQPPLPPTPPAFDPGQRTGSTINGQSGVPQPAHRLGWTNGGYQYANSPFNGQPPTPAPPMSFGGGGQPPPQMGPGQMTPNGPRGMLPFQPSTPLQAPPGGGSMPPAGAPPMPTGNGRIGIPEQQALIAGLRRA